MMRRGIVTVGILFLIGALVSVVRGQGELFPGPHLPIVLSHDPIPTPTAIPTATPSPTPIPSGVIPNGNFEQGQVSWVEVSDFTYELIRTEFPGSVKPHGGVWATWLGGVYADDDETTATAIIQPIVISSAKPYLSYWHWIASADACGFDVGGVAIDNGGEDAIILDAFNLCSSTNTGGWKRRILDLRPYIGQTVMLYFLVGTDDTLNSNWFVDDVSVQAKATAAGDVPLPEARGATTAHMAASSLNQARMPPSGNVQERLMRLARDALP